MRIRGLIEIKLVFGRMKKYNDSCDGEQTVDLFEKDYSD